MRLRPWLWPAAIFAVALAALLAGLVVVDRSGEAAISRQQAAIARSARDYFVSFAREEGDKALAAAIVGRNRALFGYDHIREAAPFAYDEVVVPRSVSLAHVARAAGARGRSVSRQNRAAGRLPGGRCGRTRARGRDCAWR